MTETTGRWSELNHDPNSSQTLGRRAETLRRASRTRGYGDYTANVRVDVLSRYAVGRKTLDIGCVDHSADRVDLANPNWLHARVRAAASECVGVDIDQAGIDRINEHGMTAVCHDITQGIGPLDHHAPFEAAVAGELVEHVSNPQRFLEAVRDVLTPGGILALSTPNPYAPWRVKRGQNGQTWESVDHVGYLFPSGMAELGERAGLTLAEAYSIVYPSLFWSSRLFLRAIKARLRGEVAAQPHLWGFALNLPNSYVLPWHWVALARSRKHGWLGEHAIYVFRRR
jgi:2-polyprenyl-3-methyl-5-hydroxy-6-metoxy-1,4-benzoquinol methylase